MMNYAIACSDLRFSRETFFQILRFWFTNSILPSRSGALKCAFLGPYHGFKGSRDKGSPQSSSPRWTCITGGTAAVPHGGDACFDVVVPQLAVPHRGRAPMAATFSLSELELSWLV